MNHFYFNLADKRKTITPFWNIAFMAITKYKQKLSRRYLLIPVVLIVFFLLFYLVYIDIKDTTVRQFNSEQLILAQTASQGITSFFNDYKSDLTFLAEFKELQENTEGSKVILARFCEKHKDLIEALTRVDAKGIILYTYPYNKTVIGGDISYQKHVSQIIATHKPVLSDVFMSVQGYLAIALHVPIFKGNTYVGSLAMLISIDKLGERYLGKMKIRGTGSVWLLSENGIEIYCPDIGHKGKMFLENTHNAASAVGLIKKIKNEHNGTAKSIHQEEIVKGKSRFVEKHVTFYRAPLGNTYWTILISYQEKDIYLELARLRNRLIFIFSLLFVVVLYYFYSLAKVRTVLKEEAKRKNAEKTLRQSEEKLRTIFDASPIGIELYKADGTQITANKASLKLFGLPDLSEKNKFNLFNDPELDAEKKERLQKGLPVSYSALFDFGKAKELQNYKTQRTGKAYFDYIITPLRNPEEKTIDGYLVQIQDISERKRNEEEILMLAHSLRSVNECVSITDLNDKILFVNEALLKIFGYSSDELIGNYSSMFKSTNNPPAVTSEILPATMNGGWKGELNNVKKDGTEFPIYLSTTVIKDKNGNSVGLIGVASDITERKRNEQELIKAKEQAEESDRLKSAFLANMSHEIRTPMNGILGFAELLKEPGLTGSEQQRYIEIIEKSGYRMLNIINDIVDISKIEAGQMEVYISETNINEQLDFIYTFFKPELDKKGMMFSCHKALPDNEAILSTDREKLFAILINLVKNAIKYTNKGSIEFGYTVETRHALSLQHALSLRCTFYVKDTGIGIPAERQQAVFERFVQADIEDRNALQGAGLGLAITKAYVEMLGGKIWLESEDGKGSVFYFTLD
jgi:PAS domain S-box-containing protein